MSTDNALTVRDDVSVVDPQTGEVVAIDNGVKGLPDDPYSGAAAVPFNAEIGEKLTRRIPEEDLDILPTGEVYASQVRYRRVLNEAFGVGGWALKPRGELRLDPKDKYMYQKWALYAHGRFISEAIGEQEYQESNKRMSYAAAAEGVKSNALTRCCKDLGIASECWDRRFTEQFKAEHCVKVFCKNRNTGKTEAQWRRKDAPKFWNESGVVSDHARDDREDREERREPKPTDKITPDQRAMLERSVYSKLGEEEGKRWLGTQLRERGYSKWGQVTVADLDAIMTTLMEQTEQQPPADDDHDEDLVDSFERAQAAKESDAS